MNENTLVRHSKSAFNYTLLLDDVVEMHPPGDSEPRFPFSLEAGRPGAQRKASFAECRTQALTAETGSDSDLDSPRKGATWACPPPARLRQSDGCLFRHPKKPSQVADFLSQKSEDEPEPEDAWDVALPGTGGLEETLSEAPAENLSNFSLSSAFRKDLSHFGIDSLCSKERSGRPVKISGSKLKGALKRRHFAQVLSKLSKFFERGGVVSPQSLDI